MSEWTGVNRRQQLLRQSSQSTSSGQRVSVDKSRKEVQLTGPCIINDDDEYDAFEWRQLVRRDFTISASTVPIGNTRPTSMDRKAIGLLDQWSGRSRFKSPKVLCHLRWRLPLKNGDYRPTSARITRRQNSVLSATWNFSEIFIISWKNYLHVEPSTGLSTGVDQSKIVEGEPKYCGERC